MNYSRSHFAEEEEEVMEGKTFLRLLQENSYMRVALLQALGPNDLLKLRLLCKSYKAELDPDIYILVLSKRLRLTRAENLNWVTMPYRRLVPTYLLRDVIATLRPYTRSPYCVDPDEDEEPPVLRLALSRDNFSLEYCCSKTPGKLSSAKKKDS